MAANFYLKSLIIQNFATFKNQTINFRPGFNAIVGETGSGKSLVLDALQLILGGRADKKVVRRETEFSLIEAAFFCDDDKVRAFLEHEGLHAAIGVRIHRADLLAAMQLVRRLHGVQLRFEQLLLAAAPSNLPE